MSKPTSVGKLNLDQTLTTTFATSVRGSPRKMGPKHARRGAGAPRVRSHPGWLTWPPPLPGGLVAGPRPLPRWCSAQVWRVGGLFHLFPLRISALCFLLCTFCLIFHLYSNMSPAKHVFSNTSGTRSIVYAYVSKVCLILLFWTLFGGLIQSLVTANKSPKLNLCSSRVNS